MHLLVALLFSFFSFALRAQEVLVLPGLPDRPALNAYWFPAKGGVPAPVVIGLHGCGGALDKKGELASKWYELAVWLNREGIHFLVPESFSSRGQKSICEIHNSRRTIDETDRRADVFAAIGWLAARPDVDARSIAVAGWSHGAQTVLKVLDRSDRFVAGQPLQPRAAVAYYPGCTVTLRQSDYALSTPLLLMVGASDNWAQAAPCADLARRLQALPASASAPVDLIVFPDSYHGFDGTAALFVRQNVGNTRSGTATLGGNPQARQQSRERFFEFLSARFERPLRMSHEQRFGAHAFAVPPASGFARIDDVAAVPVDAKGLDRYAYYLAQPKPKAFVVTSKGGWYLSTDSVNAMRLALDPCAPGGRCWLYAVDDDVVWQADPAKRSVHLKPAD